MIGSTNLVTTNKSDVDLLVVNSNNREFKYQLRSIPKNPLDKKERLKNPKGYIYVGDDTFITIERVNPLFILFPILALLLLLLLSVNFSEDLFNIAETTGIINETNTPVNSSITETTKIPGYSNIILNSEKPNINLSNPEGNTVYMVYDIQDEEGNSIFTSNAIPAGQMLPVDMYSKLSKGSHKVKFTITTFDSETKAQCNGATQEVDIIIE